MGELIEQGLSYSKIAMELGISKPTVAYHARRLGIPARDQFARRYDWKEIQRVYDTGLSVRDCMERFGFSTWAWNEAVKREAVVPRPHAMPLADLLVVGRKTSRGHLKQRLLNEGLKENRCEECGITEWRGKPLTMELHHVNGNGKDNRLFNLKFLCGNCHAQTHTWGGRNVRKRESETSEAA